MHQIIQDLNWRYATKKFDPEKKISQQDLEVLMESLRLVPTSYGLQPLKFLLVEDKSIREKLVSASFNQKQVAEASHLIVICSFRELKEDDVDLYMETIAETREQNLESLANFKTNLLKFARNKEETALQEWMDRQAYIALGQLLHTCAALKIDATPMEGFKPEEYDDILGLKERNLKSVLVCPVGYRHPDDPNLNRKKVRKSISNLFEII